MTTTNTSFFTGRRKHVAVFVAVVAVVLGMGLFRGAEGEEKETYVVERGTVQEKIAASGHVQPAGRVDVYSSIPGVLSELYVENGQHVEAGDALFLVTNTASETQKLQAKAAYQAAVAARESAEQNKLLVQSQLELARQGVLDARAAVDILDHNLQTSADNPVTGRAYSEAEKESVYSTLTSSQQAFANVEKKYVEYGNQIAATTQDEKAKRMAYMDTKDAVIKTAVAGTIANITPQLHDEVQISGVTGAEPVLSISNLSEFSVDLSIKEVDIYRVELGQRAEVVLDALPEKTFTALVSKVDSLGEVENGLVEYSVLLTMDEADERMRPGMTANVEIMTMQKDNVLLVANEFLSEVDGQTVVFVQEQGGSQAVAVEIGLKDSQFSEVLSGVEEGTILVGPAL